MPSSDYSTAGGGLKLKGAKDAGVDKRKKKKKRPKVESEDAAAITKKADTGTKDADLEGVEDTENVSTKILPPVESRGKTEAELRHEEIRRKRLEEKMKKDGVKTHKEKVEELNKYLSGLSEHHDMPKIGPG